MSTNKTTNYQLHAWETGDKFLRTEINENFAAVDTALGTKAEGGTVAALASVVNEKAKVIIGSYTGADYQQTQHITLGFRPRALLIADRSGLQGVSTSISGGFYTSANATTNISVQITDSGFQVTQGCNIPNVSPYSYLAIP